MRICLHTRTHNNTNPHHDTTSGATECNCGFKKIKNEMNKARNDWYHFLLYSFQKQLVLNWVNKFAPQVKKKKRRWTFKWMVNCSNWTGLCSFVLEWPATYFFVVTNYDRRHDSRKKIMFSDGGWFFIIFFIIISQPRKKNLFHFLFLLVPASFPSNPLSLRLPARPPPQARDFARRPPQLRPSAGYWSERILFFFKDPS